MDSQDLSWLDGEIDKLLEAELEDFCWDIPYQTDGQIATGTAQMEQTDGQIATRTADTDQSKKQMEDEIIELKAQVEQLKEKYVISTCYVFVLMILQNSSVGIRVRSA
jgi:hypothetical protein